MRSERAARGWAGLTRVSQRLRRVARRVADVLPPTPLGLLLAGSAGLALRALGMGQQDLVLLVAGYAGLGLPVLAAVLVGLGALSLKWTLRRRRRAAKVPQALRLETRRAAVTGFALPSLWWLPLVQVDWAWEQPGHVTTRLRRRFGRLDEEVVPEERGARAGTLRRVVVGDALGLARVAFRVEDAAPLTVLPGMGALRAVPVLSSLAGGDDQPHPLGAEQGDRIDLRRYAPGDPARFIHWKVFARTGTVMVRRHERALVEAKRTVAYLVAGPADDATAGAARLALTARALGDDWVFGADGGDAAGTTRSDDALALVVGSVAAREGGAAGLAAFVARAEREGPVSLVLFVPPEPGPWLARVLAVLARRRGARVVVAVDALAPVVAAPSPWTRLARVLAVPRAQAGTPADRLEEVLRALTAARAEVQVLDRASGRVLGHAQRRAMRAWARDAGARGRAEAA
jgi:uncharacterized protein (DUF58 family)